MGGFAPGLSLCGVCGEWITPEELPRHRREAHPGADHIAARSAKMLGIYTLVAWLVVVLLALSGGLAGSWLGLPLLAWAVLVFTTLFLLFLVAAHRPLSKFESVPYRCWVCETRIPHQTLAQHMKAEHPAEGRDFLVSEALFWVLVLSIPLGILFPWLWRLTDPTLPVYFFLGPTLGAFSFAAFLALYASRWPQRVARARAEWEAAHPSA